VELSTSDAQEAKRFYGELFGWQTEGASATATLAGKAVAAVVDQPEPQRTAGVPPHWLSYVTVASADDAAARAAELGGTVHAGPFDVADRARIAILADPTGAMLGVWEPRGAIGAERVNDPGCLTSNELATDDVEAAAPFYEGLFGWSISQVGGGDAPVYRLIHHDGAAHGRNGGMRELSPAEAGVPSNWGAYFTVASIEDTLARAGELGGGTLVGATEIPAGRFGAVRDPQGAAFSIFEGDVDD
jgi:predicted enzyme related to lactoylglutathione lyase